MQYHRRSALLFLSPSLSFLLLYTLALFVVPSVSVIVFSAWLAFHLFLSLSSLSSFLLSSVSTIAFHASVLSFFSPLFILLSLYVFVVYLDWLGLPIALLLWDYTIGWEWSEWNECSSVMWCDCCTTTTALSSSPFTHLSFLLCSFFLSSSCCLYALDPPHLVGMKYK